VTIEPGSLYFFEISGFPGSVSQVVIKIDEGADQDVDLGQDPCDCSGGSPLTPSSATGSVETYVLNAESGVTRYVLDLSIGPDFSNRSVSFEIQAQ